MIACIHKRMDDWSDYLVCLAVSEAGSLTGAAQELGVSQPTVTRRMQALEQRLGEPIFDRENGQSKLTPLGRKIVDHAARMREEASAIQRAAVAHDQSLSGLVVISASEGLGADWLPGALASFQKENPGICIDISIKNHPANLADREADIGLRWNGPGTQQSLVGRRAATVGAGLYASRQYLDENGEPKEVEDLADHACVAWSLGDFFGWPSTIEGSPVLPRNVSFKANSPASHVKGLDAGFGIGVTSHRLARRHPDLVRLLPDFKTSLDLWVVAHETVRKSARIRAAYDHIIAQMKADQAYFTDGEESVL
jgi:DNA-binding transcriptional LysR family regulator